MTGTLALQGFLLGLGAAAPLGPVNVEIIRRCLLIRPLAGAALGAGAVTVDVAYLVAAFLGAGALLEGNPSLKIALGLGGTLFLAWLGIGALRSGLDRAAIEKKLAEARHLSPETADQAEQAADALEAGRDPSSSLARHYVFGLLMTFFNPLTIAFWMMVSLQIQAASASEGSGLMASLLPLAIGAAAGAGGWVAFLTGSLALGRRFAGARFLMGVGVFGGLVILGFAGKLGWTTFSLWRGV
jgi:L-lysine exporter family protein LysE/ArgO